MGCIILVFICIISGVVGAFAWPYTINTWLVFAGKQAACLWWHGALLGFVPYIGGLSIPLAAATWVSMLFLQ